jgi:hypothetical protein
MNAEPLQTKKDGRCDAHAHANAGAVGAKRAALPEQRVVVGASFEDSGCLHKGPVVVFGEPFRTRHLHFS